MQERRFQPPRLELAPGFPLPKTEHVFIVGQTGSGKSTLARVLLSTRSFVFAIDTKGNLEWPGFQVVSKPERALSEPDRYVFRPPDSWLETGESEYRKAAWAALFNALLRAGDWYVYIDEGHDFTVGAVNLSAGINKLMYKGRGLGITVWYGSQRAHWIPTFVTSETTHTIAFYQKRPDDREFLADIMVARRGDPMRERILEGPRDRHGFFYTSAYSRTVTEFRGLGREYL